MTNWFFESDTDSAHDGPDNQVRVQLGDWSTLAEVQR